MQTSCSEAVKLFDKQRIVPSSMDLGTPVLRAHKTEHASPA